MLWLGLIVLLALSLCVALDSAEATIVGDLPPASGDWQISNPTRVERETLQVHGNVVVGASLTLDNTTLLIFPDNEGTSSISVGPGGQLEVRNSRIASGNGLHFKLEIREETILVGSVLEDLFEGVYIRTDSPVTIRDVSIIEPVFCGLRILQGGNASISDVFIQANAYNAVMNQTIVVDRADLNISLNASANPLVIIHHPPESLTGLEISINGSVNYQLNVTRKVAIATFGIDCVWPLVEVMTDEPLDLSGVLVRDSSLTFVANYFLNNTIEGGITRTHATFSTRVVHLRALGNASISSVSTARTVRTNVNLLVIMNGPPTEIVRSKLNRGISLVHARVEGAYDGGGLYDFNLDLRDIDCDGVQVLRLDFRPGLTGSKAPTFELNVVVDNVTARRWMNVINVLVKPGFYPLKYINTTIRVSNSTFDDLRGSALEVDHWPAPFRDSDVKNLVLHDELVVENCTFSGSTQGRGLVYVPVIVGNERLNTHQRRAVVRDNVFDGNTGPLLVIGGHRRMVTGREWTILMGNQFLDNSAGTWEELINLSHRDRVVISDNLFEGNDGDVGIALVDFGGSDSLASPASFKVLNNTFRDNRAVGPINDFNAFIGATWGGELVVSGNEVESGNGTFLLLDDYSKFSRASTFQFTLNAISRLGGRAVHMWNTRADHSLLVASIENNTASGIDAPFLDYNFSSPNPADRDYDATVRVANNTVTNATGAVLRTYGNVTVTGNAFTDCAGYVVVVDHINQHIPAIWNNTFTGCVDVMHLSAKPWAIDPDLVLQDLSIDCTGNAFWFTFMEVALVNVTVEDSSDLAIIADGSHVDVYDGYVEEGSGEVRQSGHIRVHYRVEVRVMWANATGVPSGNPVFNASVAFYNATGALMGWDRTDVDGTFEPFPLLRWALYLEDMLSYPTYGVVTTREAFMDNRTLNLDGPMLGEDALHILLVDTVPPTVVISSHQGRVVINVSKLQLEGLVDEVGSGLMSVTVGHDGTVLGDLPLGRNGSFTHDLVDLPDGDWTLWVRAVDWALNEDVASFSLLVDTTLPLLEVHEPSDGTVTNQGTVRLRVSYEPGATAYVGLRQVEDASGEIDEDLTLYEGMNEIVLRVVDEADNEARVVLHVLVDRWPPTLELQSPEDGLRINRTEVELVGLAEDFDSVKVTVHRTTTDIIAQPIEVDPDGTFSHVVTLEEGDNHIIVTAWDKAGNRVNAEATVFVDSIPPYVRILSPEDSTSTNLQEAQVLGEMSTDCIVYLNGKRIYNNGTLNETIFLSEGWNHITLYGVDELGNEAMDEVLVFLDTQVPFLLITQPTSASIRTNDPEVVVSGTVDDPSAQVLVNGVLVSLDDGGFTATVVLTEDGVHEVTVRAQDAAGNYRETAITVDLSRMPPPMVLWYDPPDEVITNEDRRLTVHGTTFAFGAMVEVVLTAKGHEYNDTIDLDGDSSFSFPLELKEGKNTVTVRLTDLYGNVNTSAPYEVTWAEEGPDGGLPSLESGNLWLLLVVVIVAIVTAWYVVIRRRWIGGS